MKKRALSLLLVFAMILSFVPTTALAAENTGGTEETTKDDMTVLQEKIDAVTAGGTVKLDTNIDVTDHNLHISKNVTLDLGGNTIKCTSSSGYYPTIYIAGDSSADPIEVTITNGYVVGEGNNATSGGIYVAGKVRKVTLNGVNITASRNDKAQAWGLTIAHPSDETTPTEVTLDKDCSVAGCGGISIMPAGTATTVSTDHLVELNVNGNVTSTSTTTGSDCAAISGNGNDRSNPKITISGNVTATGRPSEAIYLPEKCETIIESSATITGKAGIGMKSGKITIKSGAKVNGIGDYKATGWSTNGNGIYADGSAIFLESFKPPYDGDMEIIIEDGATLTSTNSYAIRENPASEETAIKSITINAGAVLNSSELAGTPIQLHTNATDKIHILGGTYSHQVEYKYLEEKNDEGETDKTKSVLWEADASGNGTGPYTYYATVNDAQKAGVKNVTQRIANEQASSDKFITLNYNDGGEGTKDIAAAYRVGYGSEFQFPDDPTATETEQNVKTFAGWKNTDTTDTKLYKKGGENSKLTNVTKDQEFTATWTETGANVKFDFGTTGASLKTDNLVNLKAVEGETNTYQFEDKTQDVKFQLNNTPTAQDIVISYQIGVGELHPLSCDANGVYTLPVSDFSAAVTLITIKAELVAKKTVTFDFGTLTENQKPTVTPVANSDGGTANLVVSTGTTYTVTNKAQSAKFKLENGDTTKKYTLKYKVGTTGTEETLEPDASGVYTLPANLADNVTVTVTAADKNTITLGEIDESAKAYVEKIERASADSNLTPKDETATETKVYVATDDTEPISFVVTAKTDGGNAVTLPENENIVVKYKLAKDEDSAYKPVSAQSVSEDKKTYTCTLKADAITGDIIVKVFLEATPVYEATPSISGSTTTTTITESEVSANITAAKDQNEPLTIDATIDSKTNTTTVTKSEVTLGGDVVNAIVESTTSTETNVDLAVKTDVGTVELPSETVSKIVDDNELTENDPLTVKVENQDDQIATMKADINAISLFDVTLMSGSTPVVAENLSIKITLSFDIGVGLINPKLYRFENGKGIELSDVNYNPKTGIISGKTDHLSQFYAAVAADASIITVLGQGVKTNGTGGSEKPELVTVQVPSDSTKTAIVSGDIVAKDNKATVALYSDSDFTAAVPTSGMTLNAGDDTVVYAKVTNAAGDNPSTAYYKITVNKAAADTDCTLKTVLTKPVQSAGGTGTQADPYVVTVVSNAKTLAKDSIVTTANNTTVKLFSTPDFKTDVTTAGITLTPENGKASAYATVTNGSTTVYYKIEVTGDAVAELKPVITNNTLTTTPTLVQGNVRRYIVVTNNPEFTIASWNTATTDTDVKKALKELDGLTGEVQVENNPPSLTNGKYIVVVDFTQATNGTVVAAGYVKVVQDVTVKIDTSANNILTVKNGSDTVENNGKVPYGTSLNLTLSNANYVVFAGTKVVPMDGTTGTTGSYTVTADTTFRVEAGHSVKISNDSNAQLEVKYSVTGVEADNVSISKGVSMVPHNAELAITLPNTGNYILMVDGVEKTLDENGKTIVTVTKDTEIEVIPGYKVTISNSAPNVTLQVLDGETEVEDQKVVAKDTELTIRFSTFANYKVQINGKDATLVDNACSHTVTADVEIAVVPSTESSTIDTLTVVVDQTGNPTVTKDNEKVTEGVTYAVVTTPKPDFTGWKNDKTEAEALTELKATAITDLPLTTANNNQYLVALQISGGKVIAAGYSDPIKVSSPTTPTTGYTVSGTVSAGDTGLTDVAGIDVTLKAEDGTRTIITLKEDGNYAFKNLANGTYTLEIALSANYKAVSESIVVTDKDVSKDITLEKVELAQEDLTITGPEDIENTDQKAYIVNGVVKGMYYTVFLSGDKISIPFYYTQRADGDTLNFTCADGTTISVWEFSAPIKYDVEGELDLEFRTRTVTNDKPVQ